MVHRRAGAESRCLIKLSIRRNGEAPAGFPYFIMSAIKDGRVPLTISDGRIAVTLDQERYILFSLNVIVKVEQKFGNFESLDDHIRTGPDRIKNLRWLLTELINEGAADKEQKLTEREVGKILQPGLLTAAQNAVFNSFAVNKDEGEIRNLLFDLNVISDMQDRGWDIEALEGVFGGSEKMANLRWLLTELINEGAADGEPELTEEQVGKMIHGGALAQAQEVLAIAFKIGNNANEQVEDEDTEPEDAKRKNVKAGGGK